MKKIILFTGLFLAGLSSAKDITVKVNGMVCDFCAQGLSKKLKAEDAVKSFDINLTTKLVKVSTKDGQTLSDEKIKTLVSEAGFNVVSVKAE